MVVDRCMLQLFVRNTKPSFFPAFYHRRWHDAEGVVGEWPNYRRYLSSAGEDGTVQDETIHRTTSPPPPIDDKDDDNVDNYVEVCVQQLWEWWPRGGYRRQHVENDRNPILVLWITADSDHHAEQTHKQKQQQRQPQPSSSSSSWKKLPWAHETFISSLELRQKYYGLTLITQHRTEQQQQYIPKQKNFNNNDNSPSTDDSKQPFLDVEAALSRLEALGQIGVEFRDRGEYYRDRAQFWYSPSKFRTVSVIHIHSTTTRPTTELPEWCHPINNNNRLGVQHIVHLTHSITTNNNIRRIDADPTGAPNSSGLIVVQDMVCTDCGQKHDQRHFHILLERRNRDWLERARMQWEPKDMETYDYSDVVIPSCPRCRIGVLRPHVIRNTNNNNNNNNNNNKSKNKSPEFIPDFQPPPPIPAYQSRLCQAAFESAPAVLLVGNWWNTISQLEQDPRRRDRHPWTEIFPYIDSASKNNVPIAMLDTSAHKMEATQKIPVHAWDPNDKLSFATARWTASAAGPVLQALANRLEENENRQKLILESTAAAADDDETKPSASNTESDPNPLVFLNDLRAGRNRLYWEKVNP